MATVLVVDDEAEIRSSLRGVLADEGLRVLEAQDGPEARELIRRERPELVLLDIWMPELDGIQLLRELKADEGAPEVVMISGHGNIETAVTATKLGAFDFIEKPISLDGLLKTVSRALEHYAARRQHGAASDGALAAESTGAQRGGPHSAAGMHRAAERTLARSVVASGHGLHSGIKTGLILQPLPPGSGIVFANLSDDDTVPALLDYVESTGYATTLHRNGVVARTVEHLLATLHAYRISNLMVKMQGEVPTMDGSAAEFCKLVEGAGIVEQAAPLREIVVDRPLVVGDPDGEMIAIEPAETFSVDYTLRYPPPVGEQHLEYIYTGPESFRDQIAPARTFGFMTDMKSMAAIGLASGGRLDNCILVDDERIVNTTLRFPDEFVRHKILDIMGDLYLLGRPIRGAVTARLTGHSDNIALLRKIREAVLGS